MADDGKIYIIVTDQLPAGVGMVPEDGDKEKKKEESTLTQFARHKFFNLIQSQAKQLASFTVSNIGNFHGDYIAQQGASTAMTIINDLIDIGSTAIAVGSKFGPWGAAIAAAGAIISKGVGLGTNEYARWVETSKRNRAIAQLRSRSGLNSSNNGSRGTEN